MGSRCDRRARGLLDQRPAGGPAGVPRPIKDAARQCPELTPQLLAAQIDQESKFEPTAESHAGAQGIAQFVPETWSRWGTDLDGDGELEYATIEPWHGEYFRVWKRIGGSWKKVFEHPEASEFYHVVVEGRLRGESVFLGGCRRGSQHLFYLRAARKHPLEIEAVTIENGVGPSNALIFQDGDRDIIVSANREIGQAALYYVRD